MVKLDGHEVGIVSFLGGGFVLLNRTLPKGWLRGFIHRQPVAALSCAWALAGVTMPLLVPPLRRAMKLNTSQYDLHHGGSSIKE
jgi:hypothetical protein